MAVSSYAYVSAIAAWSTNTHGTIALTTTGANEVLVLQIAAEQSNALAPSGISVSSVTDTAGLTWTKRSGSAFLGARQEDMEIWWAEKPTAGATTITVTMNVSIDDAALIVASVKGLANPAAPWSADASCPNVSHVTTSSTPSGTISTAGEVPLVFAFGGGAGRPVATGFTSINSVQNTGGVSAVRAAMSALDFASPVSSQAVTASAATSADTSWIVDALVISTSTPPSTPVRSFGSIIF